MVNRYSSLSKTREECILSFIKDNHGCNKEDIIKNVQKISSKKTTRKIIDELEDRKIISVSYSKLNARDSTIYLNNENPVTELHFKVNEIKSYFDSLVEEILKNKDTLTLHHLNIEYDAKVKIISLLSCVLKLITSIITEILVYYLSEKIRDKDELHKSYYYFYSKMSEMHMSFDKLKKILDITSLEYVPFFAKRNDTPSKTFLWSILVFNEMTLNQYKFILTKKFKTGLFPLMKLIYNLGRRYSTSLYDDIVYDKSTFSNGFHCFPNARYTHPLTEELKKLDYTEFIRLLIERCFLIERFNSSSARQLLLEIEKNKMYTVLEIGDLKPSIFESIIKNVVESLYQNCPSISHNRA
jgi:hypothetical protein